MTESVTRRTRPFYLIALALIASIVASGCSSCKRGDAKKSEGPLTKGAAISIPRARAAYVTNNGSDTISVFDRDGDAVIDVPVDLDPDEHEAPHHLAIDPVAQKMFVALAFPPAPTKKKDPHATHGGGTDVGRLVRLDLANLAITDEMDVDENPGDVLLTHDRARVIVTHFDMRRAMDVAAKGAASPATMFAHLVLVDAKTMTRIDSRAVCTAPHGVAITKDDKTAFVACYGSDELAVVDLAAPGLPTARIPLGSSPGVPGVPRYGPYSATLSPDESYVVLADLEGQDVRVYDRATKKLVPERTVPLAAKAFMPAFVDDTTIIVPTQAPDGLAKVDMVAAKVVGRGAITKAECALPHVVKVAKDGRVYLVCEGDHVGPGSVVELDRETLAIKKRWQVGVYPDGIALPED
ncbi:MAG: beta-propeller fold lactonase family protein [Labilithrix sp.]|nr:beta-propeller fold lactonase family protein [Labilithrix sp.]MCW5816907.1 beta-propeller fold lactonase family protein [Labilithrix sp.]